MWFLCCLISHAVPKMSIQSWSLICCNRMSSAMKQPVRPTPALQGISMYREGGREEDGREGGGREGGRREGMMEEKGREEMGRKRDGGMRVYKPLQYLDNHQLFQVPYMNIALWTWTADFVPSILNCGPCTLKSKCLLSPAVYHNGAVLYFHLCSHSLYKVYGSNGRLWYPMVWPGSELEVSDKPLLSPIL